MNFNRLDRLHRLLLPVALLALCLPSAARAQDAPTRVGVVNFVRVFDALDETKDFNEKIRGEVDALKLADGRKNGEISAAQAELASFKRDSDQYVQKRKELQQKLIDYRVWTLTQKAQMDYAQKAGYKALLDRVRAGVAQVAVTRHLDLVLAATQPDLPDDLDGVTVDDIRQRIQQSNVLYVSDKVDISQDVIDTLNAAFKAQSH